VFLNKLFLPDEYINSANEATKVKLFSTKESNLRKCSISPAG